MIKKVKVKQLKSGMFVHDFNCGWMEHPFFFNSLLIKDDRTISKMLRYGISEVYIDTARGFDVVDAPNEKEVKGKIQAKLKKIAKTEPKYIKRASIQEELLKAKLIKDEAKSLIQKIMYDVKMGRQIKMEGIKPILEKMIASLSRNKDALPSLFRFRQKDEYTYMHSISVAALMIAFCKFLDLDNEETYKVALGALLHDIGKMKVPLEILNKVGTLSGEEFRKMKEHVMYGRNILSHIHGIDPISLLIVSEHHERYNGTGYPYALKGENISKFGQMAAIVDVYDAITSHRCYRKAIEPAEGIKKIYEWSNLYFKEELVHSFIKCVGIYPVGSLVRLESGLIGIVMESPTENLLYPLVRVIYDIKKKRFISARDIDLSKQLGKEGEDRIVDHESYQKWNIEPYSHLILKN